MYTMPKTLSVSNDVDTDIRLSTDDMPYDAKDYSLRFCCAMCKYGDLKEWTEVPNSIIDVK
jgi:hypothetical protein